MATRYSIEVSNAGDLKQPCISGARAESLINLRNFVKQLNSGALQRATTLTVRNTGVAASGTITLASCPAGAVVEINGVPFTAITGNVVAANNEFDIDGTDTADATDLARAINACTDARIDGVLTASSSGAVVTVTADQAGYLGNGVTIKTLGILASGTVTAAGVDVDDTISINGVTLTGKQQRATGTITCSSADAGDTVTVNGVTLTAVAGAATLGTYTFSIDTGNNETATSLAAQINALTDRNISGVLTATAATNVVTLRAVTAGTGGNSITLASSDGSDLAVSGATLSGGAAVANNEFEVIGTNTQVATDIVRCIGASTSALVNQHVRATSNAAVVTLYAKYVGTAGNQITLASSDGTDLAVSGARLTGGTIASSEGAQASGTVTCASAANADTVTINGVVFTAHTNTDDANQFAIDGDDTTDALKLVRAINNSATALAKEVVATSSGAVVTITSRRGGVSGNAVTLASSNGTRLAVSGARLTGGAVPTTVVLSAERLASGSESQFALTY